MGWRRRSGSTRRGRRCSAPPPSSPRRPGTSGEALAALDRLEQAARRGEIGRAAIRRAVEPGGRPGDADVSPRLRPRGLARSARGLDRILTEPEGRPAMSRFRFTIANLMGVAVAAAVVCVVYLSTRCWAWRSSSRPGSGSPGTCSARTSRTCSIGRLDVLGRPVGKAGLVLLWLWDRHGARRAVLRPGHVRADAARPYRAGPAGILPALQRRRGLRGGLADLGSHGRQPDRAAQHAHRAGLAAGDLGPGRLRGEPASGCRRSWRWRRTGSWSP